MKQSDLPLLILILQIMRERSIGRYKLSQLLSVSKAKVRSLLKFLGENNLIEPSRGRGGTRLTSQGKELNIEIAKYIKLDTNYQSAKISFPLLFTNKSYSIIYLNSDQSITNGIYERDLAVRHGCIGAISLISRNNAWQFPNSGNDAEGLEISDYTLLNLYKFCIITIADNQGISNLGAMSIAFYHLIDKIESVFTKKIQP
ncbi:MAG: hypothetical protein OEZ01_02445 [Candidatus Heimdallarchaeota archaeon]|nr:hypothetical protein [Candidatus Heimdallarchaeota archaeon]MDH5644836.1 hypothetical protein [Candidatus Heimdallarchaeota archaeon]